MGGDQAVRGAARHRRLGRQRQRGQGSARPARPLRRPGPAAGPCAARIGPWPDHGNPAILGSAARRRNREHAGGVARGGGPVTKTPEELRSYRWFGAGRMAGLRQFGHRSRMRQLGIAAEEHLGKPLIAILNTWSEMNPCHMHLRERAAQVKRGVLEAGGYPIEVPVATLSETFQKPTPMMYRNLLAMEAEELLRSYPADGAV